ncbi:hypothetical protein K466DRAFT_596487 [Polyporus arcularius HHB13444]|uniref:Uncharacterized protein n=1 Tax=Polyporus arcularius HHB13444 TaxID=1314778 RepID=A0A5C3PXZ4_9APHY|nr:hypothetical protein K466DRAFT_596487 [Polyporus arcularius HHB13444]
MAPINTSGTEGVSTGLIVTIAGSIIAFIALVIGFCAVARKTCCVRISRPELKHAHTSISRRGSPIASVDKSKCPRCLHDRARARDAETRDDSTFVTPPPPYARNPSITSSQSTASTLTPAGFDLIKAEVRDAASRAALSSPGSPPPAYVSVASRVPVFSSGAHGGLS